MKIFCSAIILSLLFSCSKDEKENIIKDGHENLYSFPDSVRLKKDSKIKRIVITSTNDLNGHVFPSEEYASNGKSKVKSGGLAILKSYVDVLRDVYKDEVLLLDAGDSFKGSLLSDYTKGQVTALAMDQIGYNAITLGPNDFEFETISANSIDNLKDKQYLII